MNTILIASRNASIESILGRLATIIPDLFLVDPSRYMDKDSLYNAHLLGSKYIFKLNPASNLDYVVVRVSGSNLASLKSVLSQFDCSGEIIEKVESLPQPSKLLPIVLVIINILLSLDILIAGINYILNYSIFKNNNKVYIINFLLIIGVVSSMVTFKVFGYSFKEFVGTEPFVSFAVSIPSFFNAWLSIFLVLISQIFLRLVNAKVIKNFGSSSPESLATGLTAVESYLEPISYLKF